MSERTGPRITVMTHDRLAIEIEFVECLANPAYLHCNFCFCVMKHCFF